MIDPIKTLLGIVHQPSSPIFDLVITYFLSLALLSGLSFLNETASDLAFWHNDRSYQHLVDLGHDLLSICHIGLQTFICELNRLVDIGSGQITIIAEGDIVSDNYLLNNCSTISFYIQPCTFTFYWKI